MAPSKRETGKSKLGSSRKRIKPQKPEQQICPLPSPAFYIPEDVVENIFSFFRIKTAVRSGLVSPRFKNSWMLSRILDFGRDFAVYHTHPEVVRIIEDIFQRHRGSKIQKFVLFLDYTGVQDVIESWIIKCVDKGVEELELEFLDIGFSMIPALDFSAIETLRVLKLNMCDFRMRSDSGGLKFLKTLILTKIYITSDVIHAVIKNCLVLETLELIGCKVIRELNIIALNNKRFKSLVVVCCPQLQTIEIDSPTLESFKYCGFLFPIELSHISALKDVVLQYIKVKDFTLATRLIEITRALSHIHVLTVTNIFLEGLSWRVVDGNFVEEDYRFWNLKEFQIFMESPSYCNLFDFACFLKNCPSLERVYIDINDFTFEIGLYWEVHHKPLLEEFPYKLNSIKFVEIKGFKSHSHELDMVHFFLEKAPYLDTMVLVTPKKNKARMYYPDLERIQTIKLLAPNVKIRVCEHAGYKSPISPRHVKEWSY